MFDTRNYNQGVKWLKENGFWRADEIGAIYHYQMFRATYMWRTDMWDMSATVFTSPHEAHGNCLPWQTCAQGPSPRDCMDYILLEVKGENRDNAQEDGTCREGGNQMTKPQFTPEPWEAGRNPAMETMLDAQCPSLYANEEKNLEVLKITLTTYAEIYKLVLTDADVQACMGNTAPNDVLLIVLMLKERVETTEQLLAKCRGEVKEYE